LAIRDIVAEIDKLRKEQARLYQERQSIARIICEAYDPYTQKLSFKVKPTFDFSEEDLPLSLRKLPRVSPHRWLFFSNPQYPLIKEQASKILGAYVKKHLDMHVAPIDHRIQAIEGLIKQLHSKMNISYEK